MDSCVGAQCSIHMHVGEAQRDNKEASSQLGTLLQAPKLRGRHTNSCALERASDRALKFWSVYEGELKQSPRPDLVWRQRRRV